MAPAAGPTTADEHLLSRWVRAASGDAPAPSLTGYSGEETRRLIALLLANRLGPALAPLVRRLRGTAGETATDVDASSEVAIPAAMLADALAADAREAAERGLAALAVLRGIGGTLDAIGAPWMLWKGPALAVQVWGDPARRHYADLDIVVPRAWRDRARSALGEAGWRAQDALDHRTERVVHAGTGALPLVRDGAPLLELHWRFGGGPYPHVVRVDEVLARAESLTIGGTSVRTPARADALLLLAFHATKHGWSQAEEVVSFARLARRDAAAVALATELAARAGVSRAMALALGLASRLGVRAEAHAEAHAERHAERPADRSGEQRAAIDACVARMLRGDGGWRETHAWTRSWMDRGGDRARYLARALLMPTPLEPKWLRLPDAFAPLYPFVRVARLAAARLRRPVTR